MVRPASENRMTDPVLSSRQSAILACVREFTAAHGYAPSIREIGRLCGISSTSVVTYNLNQLEWLGLLKRDELVARSIRLVAA